MRILILSQWCYPEPDLKALTYARELKRQGHSVEILTGFPNYPGGNVYPGYKIRLFQREIIDGIEILRVPLYPSHDHSGSKRILNYLSFAFSAALIGAFKVKKADVMYVYHPPATVAIPALFIKFFRRIPVVYDIQDIWPDTLVATGMIKNKFLLKVINFYCSLVYKAVDQITLLSNGFKIKLVERGVRESKIEVVYNWPNPIILPDVADKSLIPDANEKFTVLFAGTMGRAQALDKVLDAAVILQQKGINNIQFAFIGGGICLNELKAQKAVANLENVQFLNRVDNNEVGKYLVAADVLLVHLKDDALFKITIPSKTQAYFQAGKPVVMAVGGDADEMVKAANAGICVQPEHPQQLADAVISLAALSKSELGQMGTNAKNYYDVHLSLEHGVGHFLKIFHRVANV
jgi:colanic acid biosynthesis glycosyl transferase WcaI